MIPRRRNNLVSPSGLQYSLLLSLHTIYSCGQRSRANNTRFNQKILMMCAVTMQLVIGQFFEVVITFPLYVFVINNIQEHYLRRLYMYNILSSYVITFFFLFFEKILFISLAHGNDRMSHFDYNSVYPSLLR